MPDSCKAVSPLPITPCLQDRGVPALGEHENGSLASQGRAGGLFAGVDEGGEVHPTRDVGGDLIKQTPQLTLQCLTDSASQGTQRTFGLGH